MHEPQPVAVSVPGLSAGRYLVTKFDTETGQVEGRFHCSNADSALQVRVPIRRDVALAVRRDDG
jgi:hypothetical protein